MLVFINMLYENRIHLKARNDRIIVFRNIYKLCFFLIESNQPLFWPFLDSCEVSFDRKCYAMVRCIEVQNGSVVSIYNKNERGPSTLPWGTPAVMGSLLDRVLLTLVWMNLPSRWLPNHFNIKLETFFSLAMSPLWKTVLKLMIQTPTNFYTVTYYKFV